MSSKARATIDKFREEAVGPAFTNSFSLNFTVFNATSKQSEPQSIKSKILSKIISMTVCRRLKSNAALRRGDRDIFLRGRRQKRLEITSGLVSNVF